MNEQFNEIFEYRENKVVYGMANVFTIEVRPQVEDGVKTIHVKKILCVPRHECTLAFVNSCPSFSLFSTIINTENISTVMVIGNDDVVKLTEKESYSVNTFTHFLNIFKSAVENYLKLKERTNGQS